MIRGWLLATSLLLLTLTYGDSIAQTRKVRVALPGYTIASAPFLAAHIKGYYAQEGLDAELISMRAPTLIWRCWQAM
jgi:ABC-type nitrate/sulfonate/bicarbonate transport system substrate-binding protein